MKTSLWFSWLTFVIAAAALCFAGFRCEPIEADWAAVLVGILSALVTALIGWQIYTIIDLRKMQKGVKEIRVSGIIDNERNAAIAHHAIADYYYSQVLGENPLPNKYYLIYYRVSELFHASNIGDAKLCESIIKVLNEIIVAPQNIYDLLFRVKNGADLCGYNTLVEKILQIQEVERKSS